MSSLFFSLVLDVNDAASSVISFIRDSDISLVQFSLLWMEGEYTIET